MKEIGGHKQWMCKETWAQNYFSYKIIKNAFTTLLHSTDFVFDIFFWFNVQKFKRSNPKNTHWDTALYHHSYEMKIQEKVAAS